MSKVRFDFTGERFLVTGASSGMGRRVAVELAEAGAVVLGIARRKEQLEALARDYPDNIRTVAADVCDTAAMEAAVAEFVAREGKLNGIVHAAGISQITALKGFDAALAHQMMETNFWAGVDVLRIGTKKRYAGESFSAVLFSSIEGHQGEKGMIAYAAAKAALRVAVRSIAKEIAAKRYRVNTVSPGWVNNEMTEQAQAFSDTAYVYARHLLGFGENSDVSGAVLFLLSDRARWMTGTDVVVDGGYLA